MNEHEERRSEAGRRGLAAYRRGDFAAAAALLEEAATSARGEERLGLFIRLGNAREELRQTDRALDAYRCALEIDPVSPAAWNNVGVICLRLGRLEEAREALTRARSLEPGNADILVSLGSLALKSGDPGTAKEMLERALDLESGHPLAHANLALTLAMFGRLEEAEASLGLAVLYGFDGAGAIQERIDRMKSIRETVVRDLEERAAADAEDDGRLHPTAGDAPEE